MVHDERGQVVAAVGVARDMTKEKADEETLRASEEKFFKIFQASPDCIAIVDFGSGGVLDVNERFEEITGYARSEILGRTFTDLDLLVDATLRKTMVSKLHESGSIRDFEYQMRRKTGDIATISWSAEVIEIAGRRCFVSVHRDVTGQKTAEESLHRTETKYSEVVENASDIIFTLDRDGYFLSMNRAGRDISGYVAENSRGLNLRQLVVPEQAEMAARQIERVLGGERVPTFELEIVGRAGKRLTVELDVRAIHDKDACVGVQGIARDVSMRKELEAQLRQAQKMEAIGLLAGGIAHDFNNLLTAILGYAELATRRLDPESAVREDLEEIQRAASSAESLTRQLLIFSRKGVVQPAVLDVNELVGRLDRMLRRVVGDDIDFIVTARARRRPHQRRRRADRAGDHEPRRQREGRDAGWRHVDARDRRGRDRRCLRERAPGIDARRSREADRGGHRRRHDARRAGPDIHAVLHDQGTEQRHRPRARDRARHRAAVERLHRRRQHAGIGRDLRDLPAPSGGSVPRTPGRAPKRARSTARPARFCSWTTTTAFGRWARARFASTGTPCCRHATPRKR